MYYLMAYTYFITAKVIMARESYNGTNLINPINNTDCWVLGYTTGADLIIRIPIALMIYQSVLV